MKRAAAALPVFASWALGQDTPIYQYSPATVLGCECVSECKESPFAGCFAAPICKVKDKKCTKGTASWSLPLGSHDYCSFPEYKPYEELTGQQKQKLLWNRISQNTTAGRYPAALSVLTGLMGESVQVSFESQSDIFPGSRIKYIHSVGAVAPINWESLTSKYGGLFGSGSENGFVRFSSAAEPGKSGFTPGIGLKLLRDGRTSSNFVAMPSLDGQPCEESNFFSRDFTTHIKPPSNFGLKLIAQKFWQASYCPLMVGTSDFADGQKGKFPFELVLRPVVKVECPCEDYAQCLKNLESDLMPGQAVFDVYAIEKPGAAEELIGKIRIGEHAPTTTTFGDEQLFFKHQYMEDDFQLQPEWLDAIDSKEECGMKGVTTTPPKAEKGCHSPFDGMLQTDHEVIV
ncbi:unnamed protein product [Symbiodinium pilosum]|uniref:Uncharacterized protein n=1 Tax=Symbiodinium pilosum TaxID=2952 RepID=A0A812WXR8_SYMPI|nr:unnamed protein product [Symbiodinium pilosum]